MSLKGGTVCAIRGCSSRTVNKNIILFRFPKDPARGRRWLEVCNRLDLSDKTPVQLYNSFKVCALHFEERMFSSPEKNRLLPKAIPTIFPDKENIGNLEETLEQNIKILSDVCIFGPSPQLEVVVPMLEPTSSASQTTDLFDIPTNSTTPSTWTGLPDTDMSFTSIASTQTPRASSSNTPRKQKIKEKLKEMRRQNLNIRKLFKGHEKKQTLSDFDKCCDEYLPPATAKFVKIQARLSKVENKGRRYNTEYKQIALTLYFLGPRAYGFVQKLFCLPTKRSLERMTQNLIYLPGLNNEALYTALKIKVDLITQEEKDCILCIDEMSVKQNFFYHIGRGEIVGLKDLGVGEKEFVAARNVTVIMARGLHQSWKQPLGYFFVTFAARDLTPVLEETIRRLSSLGLVVNALITDMGSNFIQLANLLGVTPDNQTFNVDGTEIIYLFDTPHLLKATRNNLLKNHFVCNNEQTSWSYIIDFYEKDKMLDNRLAAKLTDSHLYPTNFDKMKVKLAAQVLSNTVASGMNTYISLGALPPEAITTVTVIQKFNNLFDILNSQKNATMGYKAVFTGEEYQLEFLSNMCAFIKNLKICKRGKDITSSTKFLSCWLITINGVRKLWEICQSKGYKRLKPRHINQDCLENFFGSIRQQGGNSTNPTPIQFERAFKKLFSQIYFHSSNANCTDDFSSLLTKLKNCKYVEERNAEIQNSILASSPKFLSEYDYRNEDFPAQNAFVYVCGYLAKKVIAFHKCASCEEYLKSNEQLDSSTIYTYLKAYNGEGNSYGKLHVPHINFLNYIYNLEKIFFSMFEELIVKKGIASLYFECMKDLPCNLCPDFPKSYLLKLFIRLRMFYALKYANRLLKYKKHTPNVKLSILSHL